MARDIARELASVSLPWGSIGSSKTSKLREMFSMKYLKHKTLPAFLQDPNSLLMQRSQVTLFHAVISQVDIKAAPKRRESSLFEDSLGAFKANTPTSYLQKRHMDHRKLHSYSEAEDKLSRELQVKALLATIKSGQIPLHETIFTIDEELFSFYDLQPLLSNTDPPRKVMHHFFSYLNHGNKSLTEVEKVKIFDIAFSQEIFHGRRTAVTHTKRNPMHYEYRSRSILLFPLFVGHWTLLVARTSDQSMLLLDPLRRHLHLDEVVETFREFLHVECGFHAHKRVMLPAWTDVCYHTNTETSKFSHSATALYIMKHAECFARCCSCDLQAEDLHGYGTYVLDKLVRISLRRR